MTHGLDVFAVPNAVRAAAAAGLDGYEDAARALTNVCRLAAASQAPGVLEPLLRDTADLVRDTAAVQLSWARWVLDL